MLVEDLDAHLCSRQDEDDDLDEEDVYDSLARPITASCVETVLRRTTDQGHLEVAMPDSPGREAPSCAGAAIETPAHAAALPGAAAKRARGQRSNGAMGTQAARSAEIAKILAALRCPDQIRAHAEGNAGGYDCVPAFVRPVKTRLDAEERYISALAEPREAPRTRVRLLAKGEKEKKLKSLQQGVHQATAVFSQAKPKSKTKASAHAELVRLREEVARLIDQPYVFEEVSSSAAPAPALQPPSPPRQPASGKSPRPSPRLRQGGAAGGARPRLAN